MALSNEDIREYSRRLLLSRMRILCNHGFFGLLLMHMRFSVDEKVETACTDGEFITFGTDFLSMLSDSELDFVMMHEIMHVALRHCLRGQDLDPQIFNIACDIVVNSNLLLENGMNERSITLRAFGDEASMHIAPNGKEGHLYTAEEVYAMLTKDQKKQEKQGKGGRGNNSDSNGGGGGGGQNQNQGQGGGQSQGNAQGQGGGQGQGNAQGQNQSNAQGQSGGQQKNAPQGGQGSNRASQQQSGSGQGQGQSQGTGQGGRSQGSQGNLSGTPQSGSGGTTWDDHSRWGEKSDDRELREVWEKRIADAAEAITVRVATSGIDTVPLLAERLLKEIRKPQSDWRSILADFVQEDITDYSFSPPDRRFPDSPFFLPDFNEKEERLDNILFMIDTSGSMSDDMITAAYSEVLGAIEQFDGKLSGYLGFFDAEITEPTPFTSLEEFRVIRPKGGGGTSFMPIFRYATASTREKPPASIIILTDGYAPYPDESAAQGIPVLWLLVNDDVTPPFGRIARIKV